MEEQVLREMGLSEREAKVYLALLSLGETTVGPIAGKTRMQNSKVYQTLEKLLDKGLASYVIKSKTKYYSSSDPKQILNLLKEKERNFEEILPLLNQKQSLSIQKQVAKVYEGEKGIKAMFDAIIDELGKGSNYYIFALKDDYDNEGCRRFLRKLHLRISEKKSDNRLILHKSLKNTFKKNSGDIPNIKHKFTSLNLPPGLMIINDKVINWGWGNRPTAVEITSSFIAAQYKKFFLEVWDSI